MEAFVRTFNNPSSRVDFSMSRDLAERINVNRGVLSSGIKTLLFLGRQGIAIRGHRDDDTETGNRGNFKELLTFRAESGDEILENHLKQCARNAKYTSKTAQNELLLCIKEYIQRQIVNEIKEQE